MSNEDEKLWQLVVAARCHPKGSPSWSRSMDRLIVTLQNLPEFSRYRYSIRSEDLDALNRTWEWLMYHLEDFCPPKSSSIRDGLVTWINGNLAWRIKDTYYQNYRRNSENLPSGGLVCISSNKETEHLLEQVTETGQLGVTLNSYSPDGIELYINRLEAEVEQRLVQEFADYIERDPEQRLRKCFPRNYPNCHCQLLSQKLLFIFSNPPDTLANIAQEFKINYKTLHWHWTKKALLLLQHILIELGYQKNE